MSASDEFYEVSLGRRLKIGAFQMQDSRISGPPSQMLPALRDLASARVYGIGANHSIPREARITIEADTVKKRYVGVVRPDNGIGEEKLSIDYSLVALKDIIAFRVLKVEVAHD